jgi:hypothetical protein
MPIVSKVLGSWFTYYFLSEVQEEAAWGNSQIQRQIISPIPLPDGFEVKQDANERALEILSARRIEEACRK